MDKNQSVKFLDYVIKMSGDGIVISKDGLNAMPGAMNFGKVWNEKSLDDAKKSATVLFMIARPEEFDGALYYRLTGSGGAYWEHGTLRNVIKEEGLDMPAELAEPCDGLNLLIAYKGKKI